MKNKKIIIICIVIVAILLVTTLINFKIEGIPLYLYTQSGKDSPSPLWKKYLNEGYPVSYENHVIGEKYIFVTFKDKIVGYNLKNGKKEWEYKFDSECLNCKITGYENNLIMLNNQKISLIDVNSKTVRWANNIESNNSIPNINDYAIIGNRIVLLVDYKKLVTYNLENGQSVWIKEIESGVDENLQYALINDKDKYVIVLNNTIYNLNDGQSEEYELL